MYNESLVKFQFIMSAKKKKSIFIHKQFHGWQMADKGLIRSASFTTIAKILNYLENNITKDMRDIYNKNY